VPRLLEFLKSLGAARIAAMATVTVALGVTMTEIIKEQN
jgi:hypothetical protein